MSLMHRFKSFQLTTILRLGAPSLLVLVSTSMAMAGAGITTGADKLYDGPVSGAAVLTTIPAGSKVGILWCGMQERWCLVSFHAAQGFVSFSSLEFTGGKGVGLDLGKSGAAVSGGVLKAAPANTLPPMSVAGPGMAYVGGSKGGSNLVTAIKH